MRLQNDRVYRSFSFALRFCFKKIAKIPLPWKHKSRVPVEGESHLMFVASLRGINQEISSQLR